MNTPQNIFYNHFEGNGTASSPDSGTFSVFDNFQQTRENGRLFNERQKVSFDNTIVGGNKAVNVSNGTQTTTSSSSSAVPKNPKLYKTELCRSWMDSGRCNYGERCQYAHGEHEKRPIPRHPKYKTEACQSYHKRGYCPYGPRCHFIHNEDNLISTQNIPSTNNSITQLDSSNLMINLRNMTSTTNGSSVNRSSSSGDSPAPSSAESGSESPLGSYSPPLEQEDYFQSFSTTQNGRGKNPHDGEYNYDWTTMTPLINDFNAWGIGPNQQIQSNRGIHSFDQFSLGVNPFTNNGFSSFANSDNDSTNDYGSVFGAERLPVFEQLANASN
uniref:Tristetraprolin (inferred by orthology to a human protein) n=1 Tax=Strongyloides venezuelensis TaxID=75913 RepID=A0A0K0FIW5_STRVS